MIFSLNILLWEKNEVLYLLELFTARGGDQRCTVCKQGAAMVEGMWKDKKSLDEIKEAIKEANFCPLIGIDDPEKCKDRIDELVPRIIKLLSKGLTPLKICQWLGSCVSTMSLSINP